MATSRRRETCTECSLRRQKCDRQIPCGRCLKRGIADKCTTQWPGQYNPTLHRVYPRTRRYASRNPSKPASNVAAATPSREESRTTSSLTLLEGLDEYAAQSGAHENSSPGLRGHSCWAADPRLQYSFTPLAPLRLRQHASEPINGSEAAWTSSLGPSPNASTQEGFLQMLMPSTDHIWNLVDYHELYLLWYHGCYHGPTFRSQLETLIAEQGQKTTLVIHGINLQWLALLFSIMAGSLTCATEGRLEECGFSQEESSKLSMQWYKATISCLNQAEYTAKPEIHSVQAIATLTMSAHALGRSSEVSVLLGSALKIAQGLGLDRLQYDAALDNITSSSSAEQRHSLLAREIGRRLWSQLCVQDWMSLPFAESHNINPLHFTTRKPSSRSHLTMDPIPPSFPTYISYGNYLFEIAKLMTAHHEKMVTATTPYTMYDKVLEYDMRMRTLATKEMPRYFHVVEPIDPSWPPWVIWARRSLTICFAHKIIMIHRAFIRQSFTNPAYSVTRSTCVAASKTILNESRQTKDLDGPIIWIDKAFCVAAGIVLCLDIFHRPESEAEYDVHKDLVIDCIQLLRRFDNSIVAARGASLLSALLAERGRVAASLTWPPQNIKTSDILKSLSAVNDAPLLSTTEPDLASLPELFPPQAGFCNRFLFENLLQFDNAPQ